MAKTARQFALELDQEFAEVVDDGLLRAVQTIAYDLDERIKRKTPVDTGAARAAWHASVGAPEYRPRGSVSAIAMMTKPATVYLTNAMDYASLLENGYSGQAPQGMVAVSIAEVELKYGRMQ